MASIPTAHLIQNHLSAYLIGHSRTCVSFIALFLHVQAARHFGSLPTVTKPSNSQSHQPLKTFPAWSGLVLILKEHYTKF